MTTDLAAHAQADRLRRSVRARLAGCRYELEEAIIEIGGGRLPEKLRHHVALALLEVEGAIQAEQERDV